MEVLTNSQGHLLIRAVRMLPSRFNPSVIPPDQRLYYAAQYEANRKDADDLLQRSAYLERGRALFLGQAYTMAREVFEKGKKWSDQPAVLRRWAYLARIGEDVESTIFDQYRTALLEALDCLNQGNWPAAQGRLSDLKPFVESKPSHRNIA